MTGPRSSAGAASRPDAAEFAGHPLAVSARDARTVRLTWGPARPDPTPAVVPPEQAPPAVRADPTGFSWSGGRVQVAGDRVEVGFEGLPPIVLSGWSAGATSVQVQLALPASAPVVGLGERSTYLDRRGRAFRMWNTDDPGPHHEGTDPMYCSIPFAVVLGDSGAWGVFVDGGRCTRLDAGKADPDALAIEAEGGSLDLHLFGGADLAEVVRGYAALTGPMPLPPRWTLGFHQCRWSYPSAERVREIASQARKRGFPLDGLWLDIDYMDGYRVFTWNPATFPDPAGLVRELADQGIRAVTIVDPGVKAEPGYAPHDHLVARGQVVRNPDGTPYIGEVWPGPSVFPDFTCRDVRTYWGDLYGAFLDLGIAGFWNDMNEPADFRKDVDPLRRDQFTVPEGAIHPGEGSARPHAEVHNLYGLQMAQATFEGLQRLRPQRRPFLLTRAGFAGVQRYAAVWTGDNHSHWHHLELAIPACLAMGLSGVPFVGSDVGGFSGDATGELVARWTQLGAFTPFFRNHAAHGTRDQEPWAFGAEIEAICRTYTRLRYRLMPYTYTAFERASRDGTPVMRPMAWGLPAAAAAGALLDDQFRWGDDLLVAPVIRPRRTSRAVAFPDGTWVPFPVEAGEPAGEPVVGPCERVVQAPLGHLPLYGRAGAVVPTAAVAASTAFQGPIEALEVLLAPGELALSGHLYDDDGESVAYRDGAFDRWRFGGRWGARGGVLTLEADASRGQDTDVLLRFHGVPVAPSAVRGARATGAAGDVASLDAELSDVPGWRHDAATGLLTVPWRLAPGRVVIELPAFAPSPDRD